MPGPGERFVGCQVAVCLPPGHYPRRDPPAPLSFTLQGQVFDVLEVLQEWWDYTNLSPAQRTYRPSYHRSSARRGSFGLGRHYFRVRTSCGVFLIYYDRRPTPSSRGGSWVVVSRAPPADPAG